MFYSIKVETCLQCPTFLYFIRHSKCGTIAASMLLIVVYLRLQRSVVPALSGPASLTMCRSLLSPLQHTDLHDTAHLGQREDVLGLQLLNS